MQFSEEANQPRQASETEADYTERKARQKLNDFINCFDPCTDETDSGQKTGQLTSLSQVNHLVKDNDLSNDKSHKWSRYTRTNQLQRLVDTAGSQENSYIRRVQNIKTKSHKLREGLFP